MSTGRTASPAPATATQAQPSGLPQSKRDALLQAGVELFSTFAYEDVSIDDIANRANVAHGMVSYYFGGKRGLFADVIAFIWADFIQFERPRTEESTPSAIVRGYVRRHFEYARLYPERFALMGSTHFDKSVVKILELAKTEALDEIAAALGCPSASTQSPALSAAVWGWHCCLEGITSRWLVDPQLDIETITDMCVQALVATVRAANGDRLPPDVEERGLTEVTGPPRPRDS